MVLNPASILCFVPFMYSLFLCYSWFLPDIYAFVHIPVHSFPGVKISKGGFSFIFPAVTLALTFINGWSGECKDNVVLLNIIHIVSA